MFSVARYSWFLMGASFYFGTCFIFLHFFSRLQFSCRRSAIFYSSSLKLFTFLLPLYRYGFDSILSPSPFAKMCRSGIDHSPVCECFHCALFFFLLIFFLIIQFMQIHHSAFQLWIGWAFPFYVKTIFYHMHYMAKKTRMNVLHVLHVEVFQ